MLISFLAHIFVFDINFKSENKSNKISQNSTNYATHNALLKLLKIIDLNYTL